MAVNTVVPFPEFPQAIPSSETEQPQITQTQLIRVVSLKNMVAALKANLDAAEAEVRAALESGATVEPGVHVASLKESFRRNISWRDVSVRLAERLYGEGRGQAYASNVLENTKADRTVSLVVS